MDHLAADSCGGAASSPRPLGLAAFPLLALPLASPFAVRDFLLRPLVEARFERGQVTHRSLGNGLGFRGRARASEAE
jgi:hypothetical protein